MSENIEPQRLLDDPGVIGSLRADLSAASATPPLHYDVEAGLARFQARAAQASGAMAAAAAAGTGAPTGGTLAVGKVVVGIAGLLVVGGVAWALLSGGAGPGPEASGLAAQPVADVEVVEAAEEAAPDMPRVGQAVVAVAARQPEPAPVPAPAEEPAPEASTDIEPTAELAAPEPEPEPEPAASRSSRRETAPASKPAASDFLLEAKQVQQAKKALDREPARTLQLLAEIDAAFPKGQLMEERQGLRVLALIATGKTAEGKRRADAYLARYPRGTLATRVRRALDESP